MPKAKAPKASSEAKAPEVPEAPKTTRGRKRPEPESTPEVRQSSLEKYGMKRKARPPEKRPENIESQASIVQRLQADVEAREKDGGLSPFRRRG